MSQNQMQHWKGYYWRDISDRTSQNYFQNPQGDPRCTCRLSSFPPKKQNHGNPACESWIGWDILAEQKVELHFSVWIRIWRSQFPDVRWNCDFQMDICSPESLFKSAASVAIVMVLLVFIEEPNLATDICSRCKGVSTLSFLPNDTYDTN